MGLINKVGMGLVVLVGKGKGEKGDTHDLSHLTLLNLERPRGGGGPVSEYVFPT